MKRYRTVLCILLALTMVLAFCACNKEEKPPAVTESAGTTSAKPTQPAPSSAPPSAKPTETDPTPTQTVQSRDDYVISTVDEYLNRPHEIQPGTSVTLICSDIPSQVPWNSVSEGQMWAAIYESLLYMHLGDVNDIRGLVAESWTHSDDYLIWTFQIRDGIKFHDGTVCDATAIADSWDYYNEASPASFSNINMVSWEATSAKELVLTLSKPCSYFQSSMTRLAIVSPSALATYGLNDNGAAIGTGPYYIDSYTSGVGFVFKAFPDYNFYEHMPCIETFNINIIKDENTKYMALMNGDIDGYTFQQVQSFYNLQDNNYDGTLIQSYGNCDPFFFNAKKVPEFMIFEVRKAMTRFIDLNAINTIMYDDMGLVQDSIWSKGSSGAVPTDLYYYDEADGLALMASAGVDPKSMSFVAKIIDSGADMFVTIQGMLAKVGITMEVEPLEPEANFTFLMNGEWSITAGNSGYGDASPYGPWTFILKPEHLIRECWQELYDPELYQKMLDSYDAMIAATTWDEMLENCRQITKYQQDDFGGMPGVQAPFFAAFDKDIKCLVFASENHFLQLYYMYK